VDPLVHNHLGNVNNHEMQLMQQQVVHAQHQAQIATDQVTDEYQSLT